MTVPGEGQGDEQVDSAFSFRNELDKGDEANSLLNTPLGEGGGEGLDEGASPRMINQLSIYELDARDKDEDLAHPLPPEIGGVDPGQKPWQGSPGIDDDPRTRSTHDNYAIGDGKDWHNHLSGGNQGGEGYDAGDWVGARHTEVPRPINTRDGIVWELPTSADYEADQRPMGDAAQGGDYDKPHHPRVYDTQFGNRSAATEWDGYHRLYRKHGGPRRENNIPPIIEIPEEGGPSQMYWMGDDRSERRSPHTSLKYPMGKDRTVSPTGDSTIESILDALEGVPPHKLSGYMLEEGRDDDTDAPRDPEVSPNLFAEYLRRRGFTELADALIDDTADEETTDPEDPTPEQ